MTDAVARELAARALAEDGVRDLTTLVSVASGENADAVIEVREPMVLAGRRWADAVVEECGLPAVAWRVRDGEQLGAGVIAGTLTGNFRSLLRAERPLLNLMQRASGIATATRRYVDAVDGTNCRVLHTRKTAPGLRALDVDAVLAGGGQQHRVDLDDAVMIKDNHWAALRAAGQTLAGALHLASALGAARRYVEVETAAQLNEALAAGATRLLIDNQLPGTVAEWARVARARAPGIEIEATGGITLANARAYAEAGVDFISIGALTHSVRAADLAMEVVPSIVSQVNV